MTQNHTRKSVHWEFRTTASKPLRALLFLVVFLLAHVCAYAVGFRDPNQDPEGIARGNAFVATADNASAIYYNPAGITQLDGQQAHVGLYVISADTKFTSPSGVTAETDTTPQPVPQLYYANSLKSLPLSFGLGVYAPYGLSLDWGNNTPFRTVAEKGTLLYLCVNPVIAWKIVDSLSIAVGPTLNYSQAELKQGFLPFNPNDQFRVKGDGFAPGFNAGLRWQPHPMVSFGINYRSSTTVDYNGTSQTTPPGPFPYYPQTDTRGSIHFPQFVATGISFRPTKNWNFEVDVDWTDWDSVKQIVFKGTPLGDIPLVLNYRSSFMYEFGVTRQLGKGYFVSVGYIYSENSSPDKNFNPLIPDSNLQLGSIGVGHHGTRWDWAFGYHFAYNAGRDVQGNVNPLVDGTYRTFNNAVDASLTFKF
jgi:long-chain fatty acid transport protein